MKIIFANQSQDPDKMIDAGYAIYTQTLQDAPHPFPVILLPRERDVFKADETLIAVNDNNDVMGMALLEPIHDIQKDVGRFGQPAVEAVTAHLAEQSPGDLYELGGIVVSSQARGQGLGAAFYKAAARLTDNRVYAVITETNKISQNAAKNAHYSRIANAVFNAPFTVKNDFAVPDPNGAHTVVAHIYIPTLPKP
jgi:GNAT superfamily N-acetyltransferase